MLCAVGSLPSGLVFAALAFAALAFVNRAVVFPLLAAEVLALTVELLFAAGFFAAAEGVVPALAVFAGAVPLVVSDANTSAAGHIATLKATTRTRARLLTITPKAMPQKNRLQHRTLKPTLRL
jgi:hypothetical protein